MQESWQAVDDLDLSPAADGFIAYDHARDRVHHFNATAAFVFLMCNGRNTVDSIADLVKAQFDLPEPPIEDVRQILAQFAEEGLATPASR
jgi:hypothetical protein